MATDDDQDMTPGEQVYLELQQALRTVASLTAERDAAQALLVEQRNHAATREELARAQRDREALLPTPSEEGGK
jgi:hypothetical protein